MHVYFALGREWTAERSTCSSLVDGGGEALCRLQINSRQLQVCTITFQDEDHLLYCLLVFAF